MENCLNSDHLIGIRAKTAAEEVNRLRNWKRTKERFEENKARIKKDCLALRVHCVAKLQKMLQ